MRYRGRENIPEAPILICANHSSDVDPVLVAFALGRKRRIHFMAKIELFRVPLLKGILRGVGAFPVDRSGIGLDAVRATMRYLKDGENVMLFPEGTRVGEDDAKKAKQGAVRIALKTGVPILPINVPRKKRFFQRAVVTIGEPYAVTVPPGETADFDALTEELMRKINGAGGDHR
jgi:1-acyl-sn-glycerol-3-phosphate acyltransferase